MKTNHYRTFWFLFKLTLLLNVYFHHNISAASSNISKVTDPGQEKSEKFLDRNQRPARLLPLKYLLEKDKNRTENEQNDSRFQDLPSSCEELLKIGYTLNGFYLVKEQRELNKNQIEIIGCKFKHPQGSQEVKEERFGLVNLPAREGALERNKRPARLLPLQLLYEKEGNETEGQIISKKYFYGPATNCKELSILGYTLNGFYLVKGKDSSKNTKVEIISCQFKQVSGLKEVKEERFGFITLEVGHIKSNQSKMLEGLGKLLETSVVGHKLSRRPVRLIPPKLFIEEEKMKPENGNHSQFYGPAKNCKELGYLGYTLNGFYLVNGKDQSDTIGIEVVFCRFKLPKILKKSFNNEERIGFVGMNMITMDQSCLFDASTTKLDSAQVTIASTITNISTTSNLIEGVWSSQNSAKKIIENSDCNPFGYFKNEDQDICIHSDGLDIDKPSFVIRRRCNGVRKQQWAINGSHICHPVKDKCFTRIVHNNYFDMVALEPYSATSNAQRWEWTEKTKQIKTVVAPPSVRIHWNVRRPIRPFCMQVSARAFDDFGYPFFETEQCHTNVWSQQWTFIPVLTADNRHICADFHELGENRRRVSRERRLGSINQDGSVTESQLGVESGTPKTKLVSKNLGHPTVKKTGPPNCSPVGYWKNAERNICLSYDDAVDSGKFLVPRLCKGGIEQKWAINGTSICHPIEQKCFTRIYEARKDMVALKAYNGNEDQKWKWNNDGITQLITINNSCLEDADNIFLGSSFLKTAVCNKNKKTQKWLFITITDANNCPECVNFSGRPFKSLKL